MYLNTHILIPSSRGIVAVRANPYALLFQDLEGQKIAVIKFAKSRSYNILIAIIIFSTHSLIFIQKAFLALWRCVHGDITITHSLHLCLGHLEDILTKMLNAFHGCTFNSGISSPCCWKHLARCQHELIRTLQKKIKGRLELVA